MQGKKEDRWTEMWERFGVRRAARRMGNERLEEAPKKGSLKPRIGQIDGSGRAAEGIRQSLGDRKAAQLRRDVEERRGGRAADVCRT
jgi:hypothetical protein